MRGSTRLSRAVLVAALALPTAGCGSGTDDGSGDGSPGSEEAGDQAAEPDDDAHAPAGLPGVWGGTTEEDALLRVGEDGIAALVLPSEVCFGAAVQRAGQAVVAVDCAEDTGHGTGRAVVDGETLTVTWDGGADGAYERLADADADLTDLPLGDHGLDGLRDSVPDVLGPDGAGPTPPDGLEEELDELLPPDAAP